MPAAQNTNTAASMAAANVRARELDFVTAFNRRWDELRAILGIMRPIRKTPGTTLVSVRASVNLAESVGEGIDIPLSEVEYVVDQKADLVVEKYRTATTIEAVTKYGADLAVEKSDEAFLDQLQSKVLGDFYTFIQTGTLTSTEATFQMAVAMAIGSVADKFKQLRKGIGDVVVFVNTLDAFRYLGGAQVTIQTKNGIQYVQDFLGAKTLFITSDIPQGKVVATPENNIDLYYIDPGDSDFAQLGLDFTVQGETNLIGFHAQGDYTKAVGDSFAVMGMRLWAEYIDGVAVVTIAADATEAGDGEGAGDEGEGAGGEG